MKAKKFIALAVMTVLLFTGSAFSAQPEDALTPRPNESAYFVLKLSDTSGLLKWIFSEENINLITPLILLSENSNEAIGGMETLRSIAQNTPLKSAAVIVGITPEKVKSQDPFFQLAFTVSSELNPIVRKLSQGQADAKDIAKLILGTESPLIAFAETMIKVERGKDNIMRIDNAVFVKAVDDIILLGLSENDIKESMKALEDKKARLFTHSPRKFETGDFALFHFDPSITDAYVSSFLLDDKDKNEFQYIDFYDKPVTFEWGFEKHADKFIMAMHVNYLEAMTKKYKEKWQNIKAVKGGYIDLRNSGGSSVPIFALGSFLDLSRAYDIPEVKQYLDEALEQLKKHLGIAKEDVLALFSGPFSLVVNGSVMFESFKIPAVYISQTGSKGAATKIYDTITKSSHFHKVHDRISQLDSSLSPVSCIIGNAGNTLGVAFAELSSFADRPGREGKFGSLLNKESISSLWIDFAGIQSWLNDDSNGVFAALQPIASLLGYGKLLDAVRDVLNADFSVTSMAVTAPDIETVYFEFALKDVKAENGFFAKLIKLYMELK